MEKQKVKFNLVFVCTGNTCRSPMAEYMFKAYLKEKKRTDFNVTSAGLYVQKGDVLSATAHEALDILGVKHNPERRARAFTVLMAEDSDLIVTMSERHSRMCGEGDIVSCEKLIGMPISDPFGCPVEAYIECATQMRGAFDAILELCDGMRNK